MVPIHHRRQRLHPKSTPTAQDVRQANHTRFMIEGMENDDGWMMVEDELLTTARLFTAHLHHAEYQRLKGLARTRPADRWAPVPRTSDASSVLRKLAGATTEAVDDMDDEALDPYNNNPLLAELMNAPEEVGALVPHGKDPIRRIAEDGVKAPQASLESGTLGISDIGSTAELKRKAAASGAVNPGIGQHKVLGISRDQQPSPANREMDSPMRPRVNALPAKLAAKLAKRKLKDSKEDDGKKAVEAKLKDESGVADVPTFLL
jgi:hypothetical protein